MLIFIYGSDDYRARQKLKEIIEEYRKKHGSFLGFGKFDFKDKNAEFDLKSFFETSGMFSVKKLAVAENIFSSSFKNFEKFIKELGTIDSQDNFLVIFEGELKDLKEEKKKLLTFLKKKPIVVQEFSAFKNFIQAKAWLGAECQRLGIKNIDIRALELLFNNFKDDSWRLVKELEKLSAYKFDDKITKDDVLALVNLENHPNVFAVLDAFFEQDKRRMIFNFHQAIKAEIDPALIFNMLINQIRALVYMFLGQQKEIELHPFVVRKIKSQLWRFKKEKVLALYDLLADLDLGIKTGKIDYEMAMERVIREI